MVALLGVNENPRRSGSKKFRRDMEDSFELAGEFLLLSSSEKGEAPGGGCF